MAEEEEFIPYKDISELKKELEGMKGKKDIPQKELSDAVQRLSEVMTEMLEVFGAAAEQMRLEEKEYGIESKKHEMIISKLDKIMDQNRTIAEGMVSIVDMIRNRLVAPAKEKEELFKPRAEPKPFSMQQQWQPKPEPMPRYQPPIAPPISPPSFAQPSMAPQTPPDFGMQLPPMEPAPPPDLDFPEEPFGLEEPKKKGLFGMFKKQ